MNKDKRLIIFDLDGTLFDTLPDLTASMNVMLKKVNLPLITEAQTRTFIGCGARQFVLHAIGGREDMLDECCKVYCDLYADSNMNNTVPFTGIPETVKKLKDDGFLLAIMSNKPQEPTESIYKKLLEKECPFDYIYGQRPGYPLKPDVYAGELILKALSVKAENTVMVGDGETDVLFGKNLGAKSVSVLWGYRSREQLEKVGADCFAEKPQDLYGIITKKF